jgi:hypothetical protein
MSRPTNVGYEKYHYNYSMSSQGHLPKFEAARIKNGRITERSPLFDTEAEADAWIESQRGLDEDEHQRTRTV